MNLTEGHIKLYRFDNENWIETGTLENKVFVNSGGSPVGAVGGVLNMALSRDGKTIIYGANSDNGSFHSVARYDGINWVQLGGNVFQTHSLPEGDPDKHSGGSAAISSDGNRIVSGSFYSDNNGSNSGKVEVYDWDGSSWNQVGETFYGKAGDLMGRIAISGNGKILIVGGRNTDLEKDDEEI